MADWSRQMKDWANFKIRPLKLSTLRSKKNKKEWRKMSRTWGTCGTPSSLRTFAS
jgi:hypothetical protein